MNKIKIAIVGIGNCASSLIQGIHYYRQKAPQDAVGRYCQFKRKAWAGCTECGITMADKFIHPPTAARF